ncbi:hypothetical protein BX600DRAFT_8657 [Xylariales sp. PMI_506]|nr:hypothetical protein BX600DRAFT_8657 [Xylariales sp. PMI_506]
MSAGLAIQPRKRSHHVMEAPLDGSYPGDSPLPNQPLVSPNKSDDDVQFISSQPVKRQKTVKSAFKLVSTTTQSPIHDPLSQVQVEAHPKALCHHTNSPGPAFHPVDFEARAVTYDTGVNSTQERRVSTGMVGLPSNLYEEETPHATRGTSLPALDMFAFDQPLRRPRTISSPPLSPKQLPPPTSTPLLQAMMSMEDGNEDFHKHPHERLNIQHEKMPHDHAVYGAHPVAKVAVSRPTTPLEATSSKPMSLDGTPPKPASSASKHTTVQWRSPSDSWTETSLPDLHAAGPTVSSRQSPGSSIADDESQSPCLSDTYNAVPTPAIPTLTFTIHGDGSYQYAAV